MIQYGSAPVNFLLLAGLTYFVVRAARDAAHIKFALLRRHARRLLAGFCFTLLCACLDIAAAFFPRVPQLYSFPAVYTVWSLVLLIYGMAYYRTEVHAELDPSVPEAFIRKFHITRRETGFIPLVFQGLSYAEIGERLFVAY